VKNCACDRPYLKKIISLYYLATHTLVQLFFG